MSARDVLRVGSVLGLRDHAVGVPRELAGEADAGSVARWSWKTFTKQKSWVAAWLLSEAQLSGVLGSQLQRNVTPQS